MNSVVYFQIKMETFSAHILNVKHSNGKKVEVLQYTDKSSPMWPVLGHCCYFISGVAHLLQFAFYVLPPGVPGPSSTHGVSVGHIGHVRP